MDHRRTTKNDGTRIKSTCPIASIQQYQHIKDNHSQWTTTMTEKKTFPVGNFMKEDLCYKHFFFQI